MTILEDNYIKMSDYREQPEQESALDRGVNKTVELAQKTRDFVQTTQDIAQRAQQLKKVATAARGVMAGGGLLAGAGPYILGAMGILLLLIVFSSVLSGLSLPGTGGGGGPTDRSQKLMNMVKTVRKTPAGQPNTRIRYVNNEEFQNLANSEFEYFVTISLPPNLASVTIKSISDKITQITETSSIEITSVNNFKDREGNDFSPAGQVLVSSNPSLSFSYVYSFPEHSSGRYDDSILRNTITVSFELIDGNGDIREYSESVGANILIGDYPEIDKCWPTDGRISQLPGGSHRTLRDSNKQAIDIGAGGLSTLPNVYTSHAGVAYIQRAGRDEGCYDSDFGNCVRVDSPEGFSTLYAHLSEIVISNGPVEKGEFIGIVGTTGYSSGNHLHYELYRGGPINEIVPPYRYHEDVQESCSL